MIHATWHDALRPRRGWGKEDGCIKDPWTWINMNRNNLLEIQWEARIEQLANEVTSRSQIQIIFCVPVATDWLYTCLLLRHSVRFLLQRNHRPILGCVYTLGGTKSNYYSLSRNVGISEVLLKQNRKQWWIIQREKKCKYAALNICPRISVACERLNEHGQSWCFDERWMIMKRDMIMIPNHGTSMIPLWHCEIGYRVGWWHWSRRTAYWKKACACCKIFGAT